MRGVFESISFLFKGIPPDFMLRFDKGIPAFFAVRVCDHLSRACDILLLCFVFTTVLEKCKKKRIKKSIQTEMKMAENNNDLDIVTVEMNDLSKRNLGHFQPLDIAGRKPRNSTQCRIQRS